MDIKRMKQLAGVNEGLEMSNAYRDIISRGGVKAADWLDYYKREAEKHPNSSFFFPDMSDSEKMRIIIKYMEKQADAVEKSERAYKTKDYSQVNFDKKERMRLGQIANAEIAWIEGNGLRRQTLVPMHHFKEASGGRLPRINDTFNLKGVYDLYDPKGGAYAENIRGLSYTFAPKNRGGDTTFKDIIALEIIR